MFKKREKNDDDSQQESAANSDDETQEDIENAENPQDIDKKRPYRLLIKRLQQLPEEKLMKISERSASLKPYLKLPMVILIANAGVISGTSMLMLKVTDTIV